MGRMKVREEEIVGEMKMYWTREEKEKGDVDESGPVWQVLASILLGMR